MEATATPTLAQLHRIMQEDPREMNHEVLEWAINCLLLRLERLSAEAPARADYEIRLRILRNYG